MHIQEWKSTSMQSIIIIYFWQHEMHQFIHIKTLIINNSRAIILRSCCQFVKENQKSKLPGKFCSPEKELFLGLIGRELGEIVRRSVERLIQGFGVRILAFAVGVEKE